MSFGESYSWPLQITPKLSSHFGDYRAGHWHSGLDFTTQGKTGYKVYAAGDGYITRIRASYWGYGKALYIKLNNGCYAVYGHLQQFSPEIENYLYDQQMAAKSYYQDLYFKPGEYPVKAGDYIALSGQSGAGAPHLHLEIRNSDNLPINPLKDIYTIPDETPPQVDYLVINRFKSCGLGNYNRYEFLPLPGKNSSLHIADTVAVYDQLAFIVAAIDPQDGFNYCLYGADVILDGTEIFSFNTDRLDYTNGNQIEYIRDSRLKALVEQIYSVNNDNDKNIFYRLYIQPNDEQSFYGSYKYPAGILLADDFDTAVHSLIINLYDVNNNKTSISLYLKKAVLPMPQIDDMLLVRDTLIIKSSVLDNDNRLQLQQSRSAASPNRDVPGIYDPATASMRVVVNVIRSTCRMRIVNNLGECSPWIDFNPFAKDEHIEFYADYLDVTYKSGSLPPVAIAQPDKCYQLPLPRGLVQALVPLSFNDSYIKLNSVNIAGAPGFYIVDSDAIIYSPDSSISLKLANNNLYSKSIVYITNPKAEASGLTFSICPNDLLLAGNAVINVDNRRLNLNPAKISLYYYSESKDKWFYVGKNTASSIIGQTGGGGKFGLLSDNDPPLISKLSPANGTTTFDKTPDLSCQIDDSKSGLSKESQLEMTIDGIWVPAYYDIDANIFAYQIKNNLKIGEHVLQITTSDNQGNKTVKSSKFSIK